MIQFVYLKKTNSAKNGMNLYTNPISMQGRKNVKMLAQKLLIQDGYPPKSHSKIASERK